MSCEIRKPFIWDMGKQPHHFSNFKVKNASRSGKDHILKLLSEAVDSFLPISPRMDESGDLSFFVLSEDDAAAVAVMSKRITDKHNPSIKYVIYKNRRPAPYDPLSNASRQMIEVYRNLIFSH
jgi:hypothetical protein